MIKAKYSNEDYDELFGKIIDNISITLETKNDDFLLLIVGLTGTGKSSLALHGLDRYTKNNLSIDYVSFDIQTLAKSIKLSSEAPKPRYCLNDEANVSKRESLSKFNKDLIDLYMSIRGLNILHFWCNPSADMLDKHFIEERIKGLIFVTTKDIERPRIYYYFRKVDLLKIWERYQSLKLPLLKKIKKEYAYYRGWFRPFKKPFWNIYDEKKQGRMVDKVEEFYKKYGDKDVGMLSSKEVCDTLGITNVTLCKYEHDCLVEGEDFTRSITGRKKYLRSSLDKLLERGRLGFDRRLGNILPNGLKRLKE